MIWIVTAWLLWGGAGYANEEIVDDLSGATMELVWVEPGSFTMGSPSSELGRSEDEGPQHEVVISRGFYIGKYEVTQGQWEAVMGTRPWFGKKYVEANADRPAVSISWNDTQSFIQQLNAVAGDSLYRLPSEAEWEYAVRAGANTSWSFGDDESQLRDFAWFRDNSWDVGLQHAQVVGTKRPNPWGIYDMHGNVHEWVQDWYGNYNNLTRTDPIGPETGSNRILRGGDFPDGAQVSRSANRNRLADGSRSISFGFRLLKMGTRPTVVTPQSWGQTKLHGQ
jgi:formylglycine-generating enzyme required for sulfatase activity